MDILDRITFLLGNRNQKELCDFLGKKNNLYTDWKSGKNSSYQNVSNLKRIAKFFNVSLDYLVYGDETSLPSDKRDLLSLYDRLSPDNKHMAYGMLAAMYEVQRQNDRRSEIEMTTILCSQQKVSAGTGFNLYDSSDFNGWNEIEIVKTSAAKKATYALTVDGDSMTPKFNDGDIVLVKEQPSVDIGDIGIYTIAGKGYIKKFGGDRLISLNDKYEDIILSDYSVDEIRCCGLVLGTAETNTLVYV